MIPSALNLARISLAIFSKLSVQRARIVGPAPERQIPRRPGCVLGVTEARISGKPGIYVVRDAVELERMNLLKSFCKAGGPYLA